MYKHNPKIVIMSAVAASALLLAGFTAPESQPLAIKHQPSDQMVRVGAPALLEVSASGGDSFQWLRNGVPMPGESSPTLDIARVQIADAGNYSCIVKKGLQSVVTRVASLLVYLKAQTGSAGENTDAPAAQPMSGGGPLTIFAPPVSSPGSSGSCPGSYAGYVTYYKSAGQGWGWTLSNNANQYSAADGGGRSDTIIQYVGNYGDFGCDQTSVGIPAAPFSTAYRFTIYFPSNVPTTNYPIVLTGFNP